MGHIKITKETYGSPLFTIVCTTRFTRAYENIKNCGYAWLTRERERVYKYLELPNI